MVAQVGEAAMSAVSLVDTVNVLLVNAFSALATGGAVVVGQYLGRREMNRAGHAGTQLLLFMAEVSLLITALFYLGRSFVLNVVFGQVEADVAAYANLYYLMHRFKDVTGYTLHQYIRQKRTLRAGELIRSGVPVMKAAEQVGFSEYSTFLRAFQATFNMSPREFQ